MNIFNDHPVFSQVQFNEKQHTYTFNGHKLTSVSKIVSQFRKPFDSEYWAQRKAGERGVSKETILKEWDDKREVSKQKGGKVHKYIERFLSGETTVTDPFLALNDRLPEIDAFHAAWGQIQSIITTTSALECVIGDQELGIAGTFDLLLLSYTDTYHTCDWKTTKKFSVDNRFQRLLPPFDDLDDCDLSYYSLQSSLYRLILQRNTDLSLGDGYMVHLASSGHYEIHKALDLTERLEQYLTGNRGG